MAIFLVRVMLHDMPVSSMALPFRLLPGLYGVQVRGGDSNWGVLNGAASVSGPTQPLE